MIIVLGEDLTRFRNASKALYDFLRGFVWSKRAERLGFDEVFLDVTDMIMYNVELLSTNDLHHSFFHLSRVDPTVGFSYDATTLWGNAFPSSSSTPPPVGPDADSLHLRLVLGSHLAAFLRHKLEEDKAYTATVGISTSKLLSKLVGNCNKPKGQTTLLPPYAATNESPKSNVTTFIDSHGIGQIQGVGFKIAQKIRGHVLGRAAQFEKGLIYGGTKEKVTVGDVRRFPGMGPELLDKTLGGPGSPQDIGAQVWDLLNGVDESEVALARKVPHQISIEDSYLRLDTLEQVSKELLMLSTSLIRRMRVDLAEDDDMDGKVEQGDGDLASHQSDSNEIHKRWIGHPRALRLTTRPRPPRNPDGSRSRLFNRISRSGPMPQFIFSLTTDVDILAARLVQDALLPQFRKLHPEKSGWDLSLINVGATNIMEAASNERDGDAGADRDIQKMFQRQDSVLRPWRVIEEDDNDRNEVDLETDPPERAGASADGHVNHDGLSGGMLSSVGESRMHLQDSSMEDMAWQENEDEPVVLGETCGACGAMMPRFAMGAHQRYHLLGD